MVLVASMCPLTISRGVLGHKRWAMPRLCGELTGLCTGSSVRQGPGLGMASPWLGVQLLCNSTANAVLMVFCRPPAQGVLARASTQYTNPLTVLSIYSFAVLWHIRAATKTVKPDVPKYQEFGWKSWGDNKSQFLWTY